MRGGSHLCVCVHVHVREVWGKVSSSHIPRLSGPGCDEGVVTYKPSHPMIYKLLSVEVFCIRDLNLSTYV